MSFDREIGAPFILASLPRPIDTTTGRTQAAGVYSVSGSRRRKRTEIVVGVDGDGISVYSLQNPQLVTSYALPPQTSFSTAPHSLYRKGGKRTATRFTYAAVTQSIPNDEPQILCFAEEVHKSSTTDTVKSSYTVRNVTSKIVAIDTIHLSEESHDVLVIFENGHVLSLTSNLRTPRWETELGTSPLHDASIIGGGGGGGDRIEHCVTTTSRAAIAGLLRGRGDVTANLSTSTESKSDFLDSTPVLCILSRRSDHQRKLSLYQLLPQAPDLIFTQRLPLKHLLTLELPQPALSPASLTADSRFHIHSASGMLHQLVGDRLITYSFTGTVPQVLSDFHLPQAGIRSFLRISSDQIFASSTRSYGIYDTKYGSTQALLSFERAMNAVNDSKKRKLMEPEPTIKSESSLDLIGFFSESGLAVGISNHELIGVQLKVFNGWKRVKGNQSLLIDSICKGTPSGSLEALPSDQAVEWRKRAHRLEKYASKGKIIEFEELFATTLGIELVPLATQNNLTSATRKVELENGTKSTPLINGSKENTHDSPDIAVSETQEDGSGGTLRKWVLVNAMGDSERDRHRHKAMFALYTIFSWTDPTSLPQSSHYVPLKIDFFPPNVFQWLLLSGYVTKESIRNSLLQKAPELLEHGVTISDGDIIQAIVHLDPELHLLSAILNSSHFLPAGEVVQSIKILIQSLNDQPKREVMSNGTEPSENDVDADLDTELEAATHDLNFALAVLDNGLVVRSHALRPALIRLHTFPSATIVSVLRSILARSELESLVRLLHSELRSGGWTSPYHFKNSDVPPAEATGDDPENQAVAIIASLLSCALDAIGTNAWLFIGGMASGVAADDMIDDLLHDTSEALNGFWEARFMRGLLSEFLRYATNAAKARKPSNSSLQQKGKPFGLDVMTDDALPMLPLGGKVDMGVQKTKTGKGGKEEERSAREIGMLISKRVPKYSLERIVI